MFFFFSLGVRAFPCSMGGILRSVSGEVEFEEVEVTIIKEEGVTTIKDINMAEVDITVLEEEELWSEIESLA